MVHGRTFVLQMDHHLLLSIYGLKKKVSQNIQQINYDAGEPYCYIMILKWNIYHQKN